MCMSCGCGKAHEEHCPGDSTVDQLEKAAENHKLSMQQVVENIQKAAQQRSTSQRG